MSISVKLRAHEILDRMSDQASAIGVSFSTLANGARPARALARTEELYAKIGVKDEADAAVLVLESGRLPNEEVADYVAEKCGVKPQRVSLAVAAPRGLGGGGPLAARSVETAMHKLLELGFDVAKV